LEERKLQVLCIPPGLRHDAMYTSVVTKDSFRTADVILCAETRLTALCEAVRTILPEQRWRRVVLVETRLLKCRKASTRDQAAFVWLATCDWQQTYRDRCVGLLRHILGLLSFQQYQQCVVACEPELAGRQLTYARDPHFPGYQFVHTRISRYVVRLGAAAAGKRAPPSLPSLLQPLLLSCLRHGRYPRERWVVEVMQPHLLPLIQQMLPTTYQRYHAVVQDDSSAQAHKAMERFQMGSLGVLVLVPSERCHIERMDLGVATDVIIFDETGWLPHRHAYFRSHTYRALHIHVFDLQESVAAP